MPPYSALKDYMNCSAGLAWMNNATCHLPKTRKMKTQKHHPEELTKRLFRQLFELQMRLEKHHELTSDSQMPGMINTIDQLLETLLDNRVE